MWNFRTFTANKTCAYVKGKTLLCFQEVYWGLVDSPQKAQNVSISWFITETNWSKICQYHDWNDSNEVITLWNLSMNVILLQHTLTDTLVSKCFVVSGTLQWHTNQFLFFVSDRFVFPRRERFIRVNIYTRDNCYMAGVAPQKLQQITFSHSRRKSQKQCLSQDFLHLHVQTDIMICNLHVDLLQRVLYGL